MKIVLAMLADAANISQEGKLNLLGAFRSVFTPQVPCVVPKFTLVLVFRLDFEEKEKTHECWIRIADADQQEIFKSGPYAFRVPASDPSTNPECQVLINFQMLQIYQFGSHVVELYVDREPKEGKPDHELELILSPYPPPLGA